MRVLIIGLGSIALKHIKALRAIDAASEIFALRSSRTSSEMEGIKNIYSYTEIPDLKFDFAIISNPTALHAQAIETLIPFNIPLFIEKPLFDKLVYKKIVDKAETSQIKTYVACNLRFLDCLAFTKDFIKNKRINEVNSYCGSYLPDWRPQMDFRKVYSANKELGGGVHIDLIHEMDYIYWLFGMPENVNSVMTNNSSLNISAYDYTNYLLEYPQFAANIVLNYYRRDSKRTFEIVTNEGTVSVDLLKNSVTFNESVIFTSHKTIFDTYEAQMRYFTDVILVHGNQMNSINEAFQILKLCLQKD